MRFLLQIAPFDPATRTIPWKQNFGSALGAKNLGDLTEIVRTILSTLGRGESDLVREVGEVLRYRTLFALLPEECITTNLQEQKPKIREHLKALGLDPNDERFEDLVSSVKTICESIRTKIDKKAAKLGISHIYHTYPHVFKVIM